MVSENRKSSITRQEYYQLMGLLLVARRIGQQQDDVFAEIIGEEGRDGNAGDATIGRDDFNADTFLKRLEIAVED